MIVSVNEERLLVVSDVHLGSPSFHARRRFLRFLHYALTHRFNLCINGDGVDMIHTSLRLLSRDLAECAGAFLRLTREGLRVYYVVGNHDIALEHFLQDWGVVRVVPFLNVESANTRIHIGHGHLYDESFVNSPRLFAFLTWFIGIPMRMGPRAAQWVEQFHAFDQRWRWRMSALAGRRPAVRPDGMLMADEPYITAADEIARRGFDMVMFGHTHRAGRVALPSGATYMNTGCWHTEPYYAEIVHGDVRFQSVAEGARL